MIFTKPYQVVNKNLAESLPEFDKELRLVIANKIAANTSLKIEQIGTIECAYALNNARDNLIAQAWLISQSAENLKTDLGIAEWITEFSMQPWQTGVLGIDSPGKLLITLRPDMDQVKRRD